MQDGKLIVLIGPMGSGKSTLMKHAITTFPEIALPFSYTTRPRRSDHVENKHYRFVSKEEFEAMIRAGEFLEWAEFSGNYYGTRKDEVEGAIAKGKVLLKEMEVQGARQVKQLLPAEKLLTVFVNGGTWEEMERRAQSREPMDAEHIEMRRIRYEDEITFMPEADVVIDNTSEDKETAKRAFTDLIKSVLHD